MFRKVVGTIGLFVSVILIITGGIVLTRDQITYSQGIDSYDEIRSQLNLVELEESMKQVQDNPETDEQYLPDEEASDDTASEDRFSVLSEVNSDVRAWIWQEGTCIDYPVVIGEDNTYYLNHLFNGEKNKLGCLFIDYRNNGDFSDRNTVIYGHNMKNGTMFHSITDYKDPAVYATRPTMTIYTPDGTYNLELFAGVIISGDEQFVKFDFSSEEEFLSYAEQLKENSTFESDVAVLPGDRLVTLCTCSYEFDNYRYELVGKLSEQ